MGDSTMRPFSDYQKLLKPSAPILERRYLYGRAQELLDLERAMTRDGHHPIVIGARGVGKTSLVRVALLRIT
jgi:MoxR-like ATPase